MKDAIIGLVQVNLEHRGQDGSNLVETKLLNLVCCVKDGTRLCVEYPKQLIEYTGHKHARVQGA